MSPAIPATWPLAEEAESTSVPSAKRRLVDLYPLKNFAHRTLPAQLVEGRRCNQRQPQRPRYPVPTAREASCGFTGYLLSAQANCGAAQGCGVEFCHIAHSDASCAKQAN